MITVAVRVEIADIPPGAETDGPGTLTWSPDLEVRSYGDGAQHRHGCVQITLGGRTYAVNAKDLIAAVQNASNTGDP